MKKIIEKVRSFIGAAPQGTFECPICKKTSIHSHTSEEIVRFSNSQKAAFEAITEASKAINKSRQAAPKPPVPGEVKTKPPRKRKPRKVNQDGR